jgi:hypothetical protein
LFDASSVKSSRKSEPSVVGSVGKSVTVSVLASPPAACRVSPTPTDGPESSGASVIEPQPDSIIAPIIMMLRIEIFQVAIVNYCEVKGKYRIRSRVVSYCPTRFVIRFVVKKFIRRKRSYFKVATSY